MDSTATGSLALQITSLFVSLGGAVLALLAHYRISSCRSKLCNCVLSEDTPEKPDIPKLIEP
jgi:hypothetical protein